MTANSPKRLREMSGSRSRVKIPYRRPCGDLNITSNMSFTDQSDTKLDLGQRRIKGDEL